MIYDLLSMGESTQFCDVVWDTFYNKPKSKIIKIVK